MLEDNSAQLTLVGFDVFNPFPQDGSESLSITQSPGFGSLGEIEFIPFPDHLKGNYQSFTEADLTKLRNAGYDAPFKTVQEGVKEYMEWLHR